MFEKIKHFREMRKSKLSNKIVQKLPPENVKKKIKQSVFLPKVMNLNHRSIYNKIEEFVTFVQEESIAFVCMSESHERAYPTKKVKPKLLKIL